jgi:cell division cycle protein 37
MPLNYSKWDQLELSDDSDIEGHPNVDKKSLIRWKQRDIHEKREVRKRQIQALTAEIACNTVLVPRLQSILAQLSTSQTPLPYLSGVVEQLQTNPSPDAPPTNAPGQPTYDAMVLSLLLQVSEEAKKAAAASKEDSSDELVGRKVKEGLKKHLAQLGEHTEKLRNDLETEEKEQKKHITSEDMHDGFDSKYTPAKPEPAPIKNAIPEAKSKSKSTTTSFEVLNPKASSSSSPAEDADEEDEDTPLPSLTPSLLAFSRLPLYSYEASWKFIQAHRDVVVPGAADALLVAAFKAQAQAAELAQADEEDVKGKGKGVKGKKEKERKEEEKYAKQCVCQSLLLSYCEKLGGDGVRVFFQKMVSGDPRAELVFVKDVEDTYTHLITRVQASLTPSSGGQEQIQLVAENPTSTISFNVPTSPPPPAPEPLTLEGPGAANLDPEEVRRALQLRWDVFTGLSGEMQEALQEGTLEGVNKVLGSMPVSEAEQVVKLLDVGGILSFAEGGIRDETGRGVEGEDEDGDDYEDVDEDEDEE